MLVLDLHWQRKDFRLWHFCRAWYLADISRSRCQLNDVNLYLQCKECLSE